MLDMAVREIPLTQGFVALVDESDWNLVRLSSWCVTVARGHHHSRYAVAKINRQVVRMHRLLLNAPPGVLVDHINCDGLDNRRCNLRICTKAQNAWNRRHVVGRFKGVWRHSSGSQWVAKITCGYKEKHIGLFATEEEAAHAYDAKALELFGPFARLNFPEVQA